MKDVYKRQVAENHIVVENGGIGYNIYIPGQVLSLLPGVGEEVKIYTYLCVREDAQSLSARILNNSRR